MPVGVSHTEYISLALSGDCWALTVMAPTFIQVAQLAALALIRVSQLNKPVFSLVDQ